MSMPFVISSAPWMMRPKAPTMDVRRLPMLQGCEERVGVETATSDADALQPTLRRAVRPLRAPRSPGASADVVRRRRRFRPDHPRRRGSHGRHRHRPIPARRKPPPAGAGARRSRRHSGRTPNGRPSTSRRSSETPTLELREPKGKLKTSPSRREREAATTTCAGRPHRSRSARAFAPRSPQPPTSHACSPPSDAKRTCPSSCLRRLQALEQRGGRELVRDSDPTANHAQIERPTHRDSSETQMHPSMRETVSRTCC